VNGAISDLNEAIPRETYLILQGRETREELLKTLDWFSDVNFPKRQEEVKSSKVEWTGQWLPKDPRFKRWLSGEVTVLWCPGKRKLKA